MKAFGFDYQFVPGKSDRTLLLLHGTGGDENDLLPLGRALDGAAALLSPRGQVSEQGANRYFRRFDEGVFDEADVVARAEQLGAFLDTAMRQHGLEGNPIIAVGYSNGANIAAAMLLLGLAPFKDAILFRPMSPLTDAPHIVLPKTHVLIGAGRFDAIATVAHVEKLVNLFRNRSVQVDLQFQERGHELADADFTSARDWLASAAIA